MTKFLFGGVAAAAILAAGAAFAQTAPQAPGMHPGMAGMHEGHMMQPQTRAEVQAHATAMFAKLDANHDGFITKDELNAFEAQQQQKMEQRAAGFDPSKIFARMDLNHDGQITVAEAEAAHGNRGQGTAPTAQPAAAGFRGLLARVDANKDGVISKAEFDAATQQMKAHMQQAGMHRAGMAGHMFDDADSNKDGRVSLAEMQQAALAHFDRADLNHDGTITPDERQQAHDLLKGQYHPD